MGNSTARNDDCNGARIGTGRPPPWWKSKPGRVCRLGRAVRGQGLLELAIVLPVLLVLLLGLLDVGRAYYAMVSLKDAVSEGASYAASHPTQTTQILERAADASSAFLVLTPDMFTIDYVDPPTSGQPVTVSVAYDMVLVTPFVSAIVPGGTLTLRASDSHVIY